MNFYISLFPGSEVAALERYGPGQASPSQSGVEGTIRTARFTLAGQTVLCTDSVVKHGFTYTSAFSFFVPYESADEIQRLSAALSDHGSALMPLGEYGLSRKFAWVSDRYSVSWQLNLE